jgi:hypothetical protein
MPSLDFLAFFSPRENKIVSRCPHAHRHRRRLKRGSFLWVWEGGGLIQLSPFSRYDLPIVTTEIYL